MNRLTCSLTLAFCTLALPLQAMAHDFWVNASHDANKAQVKAQIGYGHGFPELEAIAADRAHIFNFAERSGTQGEAVVGRVVEALDPAHIGDVLDDAR